jgi:hypothetical protein
MPNDVPPRAPVSAGSPTPATPDAKSASRGGGATPQPASSPKPSVVHTPAGRPLLHFSDYDGQVYSALTGLSGAINKLGAAVEKFGDLPQHDQVMAWLRKAQTQANGHLLDGAMPHERELSLALSAMTGGKLVSPLDVIGFEQYDTLDVSWFKSFLNYLTTPRVPFPTHQTSGVKTFSWMPEQVTLALAGDWGTGIAPATSIGGYIAKRNPDYTIHLGDVYYSGLPEEESSRLVELWPAGGRGSLTLNSNHEMYAGGRGYFDFALTDRKFALQNGLSYFVLQNRNWMIIGLDTAYFADTSALYQDGYLSSGAANGTVQRDWLRDMIRLASHSDMNVIILTHHDGFDIDPYANTVTFKNLFGVMTSELQSVKRWWWYWGHVHAGIAYQSITKNSSTLYPRCIGHGGIPWEPFPDVGSIHLNDPRVNVEWAEVKTMTDSKGQSRALNGYLMVTLDGANITETLYDENNQATSWKPRY